MEDGRPRPSRGRSQPARQRLKDACVSFRYGAPQALKRELISLAWRHELTRALPFSCAPRVFLQALKVLPFPFSRTSRPDPSYDPKRVIALRSGLRPASSSETA